MRSFTEEDKKILDENINKTIQIAALKKIADLVNQAREEEKDRAFLLRRFLITAGILTAIIVAVCIFSPQLGAAFLRLLTVLSR
jgi:MFS-type transporter involved in bile tolerance (Atg22 family)